MHNTRSCYFYQKNDKRGVVRLMNINDLTIFKTIYEEHIINKASKKLGYAKSNITARFHAIEEECNTNLFVRNYTGVTPTKKGEIFYGFVVTTLSKLDSLKQSFSNSY